MIKATIIGNLVSNPELKEIKDKKVCIITIASNRYGKDTPDVLRVEIWGKTAENCNTYLKKGSSVAASGDLSIDLYKKNEDTHVSVKLVNAEVEFMDRKTTQKGGEEEWKP